MRTRLPLAGLVLSILCLFLLGAQPTTQPAEAPTTLRVMSYNIHHGRGTDGKVDLERIADIINAADVDLVALQEVDVKTTRSGGVDQPAELARLTGMHVRFGKARDYQGGDYGQAILSKFPIDAFEVHALPPADLAETRIALFAHIPGPTTDPTANRPDLLFVGTHLHHANEDFRLAQVTRLLELLRERSTSFALVTGDLNATPGSPPMERFLETWQDTTGDAALTFPAPKPDRKIDWLLLPKESDWRVTERQVLDEPTASDHRPIVVELQRAQ